MVVETSVVVGLGIVSAICAFFGIYLIEKQDIFNILFGKIFFIISLSTLLLIVNTTFLIIKNTASLSYLQTGIADILITSVYYAMIVGLGILIIEIFWNVGVIISNTIKEAVGNRKKGDVD